MTIYVKDLAEAIATKANVTKAQGKDIVESVFSNIVSQLQAGNTVYISGFGEFEFVQKAARKARNPRTGEKVDVPSYKKMVFTPVKNYRKIV